MAHYLAKRAAKIRSVQSLQTFNEWALKRASDRPEEPAFPPGVANIRHSDRPIAASETVIALCLVWMSVGGRSILPVVDAQQGSTDVVVAGWRDANGQVWPLPATEGANPGPLALQRHRDSFERRLRDGARLPVAVPERTAGRAGALACRQSRLSQTQVNHRLAEA